MSYAFLSGVLASMTTNIDDFQQLQTPLMLIITIGFYLSIFAMIFDGSLLIKILSYFPMISFMLSPSLNQSSLISLLFATFI